jgi:dynamin 1-like protein
MVTRTPICIQLIQSTIEKIEFTSDDKYNLTKKSFEINSMNNIKKEIERRTIIIAGPNKGISLNKITIKIFSKNVPNLTLIDLPGITMVACTDKGQPKDIKEQIENMIGEYIKSNKTIILAVIPARSDIEADVALGIIKKYDPNGERTLGILTKVDLMSRETNVSDYLTQNISKDLQVKYGYYLVRNRTNSELNKLTIEEGFDMEMKYFNTHNTYSKLNNNLNLRLGTNNLRSALTCILTEHIKMFLPAIQSQILETSVIIETKLSELGPNIEDKGSLLHILIADFCKKITDIIEEKNKSFNIGRKIKDTFTNYKKNINIQPFLDYKDEYITNIIKNCEGNHMSSSLPPIEVLEYCLTDNNKRPIQLLKGPSIKCIDDVINELLELVNIILKEDVFARFPKLVDKFNDCMINDVIMPKKQVTVGMVDNLVLQEEAYIWTDNKEFLEKWNLISIDMTNDSLNKLKEVLTLYYDSVIMNLQNNVPKCIMLNIMKNINLNLSNILFGKLAIKENECLLNESDIIINKRKMYIEYKNKLDNAKKILEN